MPSGKRETVRKGNAPVNTSPSPNSDGRANNPVEEAEEPARGSYAIGHHRSAIWLNYAGAVCSPRSVSLLPSTLLRQHVRGAAACGFRWPELAYT
ncbi:LIM domain-binding protein [Trichinella spiralis]|uniref:LIM domain-binding protein n=1 Tax=Trichinella spiralis TaxID=6334 RepID=A0ABR3K3M6_TRISP